VSAETILAAAVLEACEVEASLPYRPANLTHRLAFVAPSDVWKQFDEDSAYCEMSVGLDVYLVAGSADVVESFNWLDEQTTILMDAGPIDVGTDTVTAAEVAAPFIFSDGTGASYLTARVTYSRFRS